MRLTETEAHTVMLHALINDMRLLLEWLTIGLFAASGTGVLRAIGYAYQHAWISVAFESAVALTFGLCSYGAARRARKYRKDRAA